MATIHHATIHHATKARATKLGFEIIERDGEFAVKRLADEAVTRASFDSAKDALAHAEVVGIDWILPETEGAAPRRNHSGMMGLTYHARYMAQGGGCGDTLDETLRATFLIGTGKSQRLDVQALRGFGESLCLWNSGWDVGNPGHCRMNLANRIRARLRNDAEAKITIGETTGRFGIPYEPNGKLAKKLAAQERRAEKAPKE